MTKSYVPWKSVCPSQSDVRVAFQTSCWPEKPGVGVDTESGQTLQCSFSLSTPPTARVGSFFRIFRDLHNYLIEFSEVCWFSRYLYVFVEFFWFLIRFLQKFTDFSANRWFFAANFTEFCQNCGKFQRIAGRLSSWILQILFWNFDKF